MKARIIFSALAAAFLVALAAGPASAHTVNKPTVSCEQVSASASGFSSGAHTVTFHVTVQGNASTKSASFSGSSGTPSASIHDLTLATGPLTISAYATWTDDGGGSTDTATVTETCHTPAPPTTEKPPTSTSPPPRGESPPVVPSIPVAPPNVTSPSTPSAAVPVVAVPNTTG